VSVVTQTSMNNEYLTIFLFSKNLILGWAERYLVCKSRCKFTLNEDNPSPVRFARNPFRKWASARVKNNVAVILTPCGEAQGPVFYIYPFLVNLFDVSICQACKVRSFAVFLQSQKNLLPLHTDPFCNKGFLIQD
jgi:hypothetical protein